MDQKRSVKISLSYEGMFVYTQCCPLQIFAIKKHQVNEDFRYMKIHIFALRWKDEIRRSSQLKTLLKRVVVNRTLSQKTPIKCSKLAEVIIVSLRVKQPLDIIRLKSIAFC